MNFRLLALSFVLVLSSNSWSADTLFTATYKGRHTGIGIKLVRKLEQEEGQNFILRSKATSFIGSITEHSEFELKDKQIIPHQYDYTRKVLGNESVQKLSFDWDNMQAHFRRDDKPKKNKDYELLPGALDPSLYQLKLQQELFKGKTKFSFDFAKKGRMKKLEFQKQDTLTTFDLNDRKYTAIVVERINQPDQKQTKILVIPSLSFQIAKIIHTEEDGSKYQIELTDFSSDTKKLAEFYRSIEH